MLPRHVLSCLLTGELLCDPVQAQLQCPQLSARPRVQAELGMGSFLGALETLSTAVPGAGGSMSGLCQVGMTKAGVSTWAGEGDCLGPGPTEHSGLSEEGVWESCLLGAWGTLSS